jgi:hypothetical protein
MTGDARRASSLPPPDDDLARLAGKLAGKVGAIAESIEGRLSQRLAVTRTPSGHAMRFAVSSDWQG